MVGGNPLSCRRAWNTLQELAAAFSDLAPFANLKCYQIAAVGVAVVVLIPLRVSVWLMTFRVGLLVVSHFWGQRVDLHSIVSQQAV